MDVSYQLTSSSGRLAMLDLDCALLSLLLFLDPIRTYLASHGA